MNSYEQQIQSFARKIKKYEEDPDPTLLWSNKLLYEQEKELAQQQLDAWQQGKPFAEARLLDRLVRAMGCQRGNFSYAADRAGASYFEYKATIERMGFPEKCCDRTVGQLAMCEVGDLPKPHFMVVSGHACDAHKLVHDSITRLHNIPAFHLDVSLNSENKPNLDSLNYIADQLGDFIEWAEKKVPGVKYDRDKHIEIQELDAIGLRYLREIYLLRKSVPCPIAPADSFSRLDAMPRRYPDMQKAIEYLRICRDELGERVASGKGPYAEERLRLLWASGGEFYFKSFWMFMDRKVAVPLTCRGSSTRTYGLKYAPYGEMTEYGIKLSPLQEEARGLDTSSFGGPGKRWVTDVLDTARDLGAHGIVHDLQVGCGPVLGIGSMIAERAEKELRIPVLNIENRHLDPDFRTEEQFEEILSSFIDKCFDWAGKSRQ